MGEKQGGLGTLQISTPQVDSSVRCSEPKLHPRPTRLSPQAPCTFSLHCIPLGMVQTNVRIA